MPKKNKPSADKNLTRPDYVVAIGASAGGLEAIQDFFDQMPENTGAAFVVIQHLSPDFKSLMDQLLSRNTDMKILPVKNDMRVEKNTIYLIPPKQNMHIKDGHLKLTEQKRGHYLNLPVDIFLESLAKEYTHHAIAVILSGTGSDGSKGVVELSKLGGLTLVQDPESAKFDGMPRNAITTKCVDRVLVVEKIPQAIVDYIKSPDDFYAKPEVDPNIISTPQQQIFALLMSRHKVDFGLYKPATVSRRFDRRLQALNLSSLSEYADIISRDQQELDALYKDLLIGVTNFFRDSEAFDLLQSEIVPKIVEKHQISGKEIRIWSPACSTGEEAYSLGMTFKEYLLDNKIQMDVKVFATDISKDFIDIASSAIYTKDQVANVSSERLKRFFVSLENGYYQIIPDIRNMVVFAQHSLINDPPFTRMDLVSCRNFLIYIQPHIQKKILGFLRFALNIGGYLFLGPSETLGELGHDLDIVNSNWKMFEKIAHVSQHISLTQSSFIAESVSRSQYTGNTTTIPTPATGHSPIPIFAYDLLLDRVIENGLLIDNRREIIHVFGEGKRFVNFEAGRITTDIVSVVLPELKSPLTTGLHRANMDKKDISYADIPLENVKNTPLITMQITPLLDQKQRLAFTLIQFKENKDKERRKVIQAYSASEASDQIVKELEYELKKTKESLQATIEEVETTNEELQSTNEELLASNEELQSTNEELHSVNEELYTVNAEHQKKIEELTTSNNDIDNFIRSTDIGTIFIDANLTIKRYTPAIAKVFELLPQDIGRALKNFTYKIQFDNLIGKVKSIIKTKKVFTQEVQTNENEWFFMRIQPYLIKGGSCEGAVITFFDIHDLKQAHHELVNKESRYRALIEATSSVVWETNSLGEFEDGKKLWCEYTGQKLTDIKKMGWLQAIHQDDRYKCEELWQECLVNKKTFNAGPKVWSNKNNAYHYVRLEAVPIQDINTNLIRWVFSLTDIDVEKRFDEKFRLAVEASPFSFIIVDNKGIIYFVNSAISKMLGYKEKELLGQPIEILVPEESRERHGRFRDHFMQEPQARLMGSGIAMHAQNKAGENVPIEIRLSPIQTDDGIYILCSIEDISKRIQAEKVLQRSTDELEVRVFERTQELVAANETISESERKYALLYEGAPDMYASVSPKDGCILQCNTTLAIALGYKDKSSIVGKPVFEFYSKDSQAIAKSTFKDFLEKGYVNNTELELLKKNGDPLPVMLKVKAVRDENGKILYSISSWRDITVQKALEQEKRASLELDLIYRSTKIISETDNLNAAFQSCMKIICELIDWPVGHLYVVDDNSKYLKPINIWSIKNPRKLQQLKTEVSDITFKKGVGLPGKVWESKHPLWIEDFSKAKNNKVAKIFKNSNILSSVCFPIIVYGHVKFVCEFLSLRIEPVNHDLLEIFQVVGEQVGHVLERKQVEEQYQKLARYDIVTGLPNRIYFKEVLGRLLLRKNRQKKSLALLYLDVDNFKKINDSLGHFIGDLLLKEIADLLQANVRTEDFLARLGGDEFVILIDDVNSYKKAINTSEKILKCLSEPFRIDKRVLNTSISIGISLYLDEGDDADSLLKNADIAMYRAKNLGKNTFQFFSEELNQAYQRQISIESHLKESITKNELYLLYQPQISLETGSIYGVEALLRWDNKMLGNIPTEEFISIAEESDLINSIGEWVLEEACQQLKAWQSSMPKFFKNNEFVVSINLSMLQLVHGNIRQKVQDIIKRYKINPRNLMLEITETALMSNLDDSIKEFDLLSQTGVGIAVDDFGTGYSSLSYLKELPFTALKIDQSFIKDVDKDPNDSAIVKAIIQMGSVLNLMIIAEGVETKKQLEFLKDSDCHHAQGFYLSKPVSPADIQKLLRENKKY